MISHKIRQVVDTNIHDATSKYKVSDFKYYYPHTNYNINWVKMQ